MRALILSGGAGRGSFQVGVLRGLLKKNKDLDYDIYVGSSVGAFNAGILAGGPLKETVPILEDIWLKKITGRHSIWHHLLAKRLLIFVAIFAGFINLAFFSFLADNPKWLTTLLALIAWICIYLPYRMVKQTRSVYTATPLKRELSKYILQERILHGGKSLVVAATCLRTGELFYFTESDVDLIEGIHASMAFPVFFPPVFVRNEWCTDGGLKTYADISSAIDLGATEVDVILTVPLEEYKDFKPTIFSQVIQVIDVVTMGIIQNDIKKHRFSDVKINIYMPPKGFSHKNPLKFEPASLKKSYNVGVKVGEK